MSILIRDKKMPENCQECFCLNDEYFYCQATSRKPSDENVIKRRPDWCPLIEIQQHGRLIDADALGVTDFELVMCRGEYKELAKLLLEKIDAAPTIIPADVPENNVGNIPAEESE